ncbi:MAG: ABC transporter ATP-binding protein, partial [Planctomycetota bacterium]
MLRLEDYCWKFDGSDSWTLDGVNMDIAPGECVLLAGPSGAGKSTLVLAMAALLKSRHAGTTSGRLYFDETDITGAGPQAVAGSVAVVQQNPDANFATLSVEDEVAFALENQCAKPDTIAASVDHSLRLLDLESLRERQLSTLSEGQKQRVAVAAALAGTPKVLILDEPTANLDPDATREVLQALGLLIGDKDLTVIIAEQRLYPFAALRPRVVVLEGGKVAGDYAWPSVPREIREPLRPDANPAERPVATHGKDSQRVTVEELTVRRG